MVLIIKGKLLLVFVFVLSCFLQSHAQVVFEVQDSSLADFSVCIIEDTIQADFSAFIVNGISESTQVGLWYQTSNINEASYKIYYINDFNLADLTIYFTQDRVKIGWIHESYKVRPGDKFYLLNK